MEPPAFFNRDLQWLEFNARVLAQSEDPKVPLLERLRFLGIFSSNLDEFFMKRVGGLRRRREAGLDSAVLRGRIRRRVKGLLSRQARCWLKELRPALAEAGIELLPWRALGRRRRRRASDYFHTSVFPVLTPLAVSPGHPFPLVSNLSTSIGVLVRTGPTEEISFARVKIPPSLPQWVPVEHDESGPTVFTSLSGLIAEHLDRLFPGMEIVGTMAFRVTRNADIELGTDDAEDLLELVTEEIRERRFARVVRLEHGPRPNPDILRFLMRELDLEASDLYEVRGALDGRTLWEIADLPRPELRWPAWVPVTPPAFDDPRGVFATIRERDLLVHHPYESFATTVLRFVTEAADDPRVLALKMTLYRTGEDSPFVPLLIRAAEKGKQVVCLVELKARFDEARNIAVARTLERAGVHVVYGLVGVKTHCKLALVVRQEGRSVRAYAHIGTGNYHLRTASLYTDLGLFTADPVLVEDTITLFNALTGRSASAAYAKLLVSPQNMKKELLARIRREAAHARKGKPARIVAKMNQFEDKEIGLALYEASSAGVPIDLLVRGFCVLRPGVPGLSDQIRVSGLIGRFLEHSRVFHFANGQERPADGEFFLGSADWMHRNLDHRVETLAPVEDPLLKARLWHLLETVRDDHRLGWDQQPDGTYRRREPRSPREPPSTQQQLMRLARERAMASP